MIVTPSVTSVNVNTSPTRSAPIGITTGTFGPSVRSLATLRWWLGGASVAYRYVPGTNLRNWASSRLDTTASANVAPSIARSR